MATNFNGTPQTLDSENIFNCAYPQLITFQNIDNDVIRSEKNNSILYIKDCDDLTSLDEHKISFILDQSPLFNTTSVQSIQIINNTNLIKIGPLKISLQ